MIRILTDGSLAFWLRIVLFLCVAIALVFSIVLHEISHGLVAKWNGDNTAYRAGRITLNPLKHFDPLGALMILLIGFGYARPVPVNPNNFRNYKRGMALVSIAGVTMNIIIAFVASALYVVCARFGGGSLVSEIFGLFFYYLSRFNVSLFFFNLLPFFPLDGFNLIRALSKRDNAFIRFMYKYGQYILFALIIVSLIVSYLNVPIWFSPFDLYFNYTANFVSRGFIRLWILIFGGV